MVSLNFTTGKGKILDGSKEMTIRALRKRPIKVWDKLHLFSGLRTKNCERLKEAVCLYEKQLTWGAINALKRRGVLAKLDGFANLNEMENWFYSTHRDIHPEYPFQIICWGQKTKTILERILKEVEEDFTTISAEESDEEFLRKLKEDV